MSLWVRSQNEQAAALILILTSSDLNYSAEEDVKGFIMGEIKNKMGMETVIDIEVTNPGDSLFLVEQQSQCMILNTEGSCSSSFSESHLFLTISLRTWT